MGKKKKYTMEQFTHLLFTISTFSLMTMMFIEGVQIYYGVGTKESWTVIFLIFTLLLYIGAMEDARKLRDRMGRAIDNLIDLNSITNTAYVELSKNVQELGVMLNDKKNKDLTKTDILKKIEKIMDKTMKNNDKIIEKLQVKWE
jgi:hypothetical protein